MTAKTRIGILGIGGVGGYFGGMLAHKYFNSYSFEIIFIARNESEKIIKKNGLKIISSEGEKIVFPDEVTSDPSTVGPLDFLICCIKSYDLEPALISMKNSIGPSTIILPLLNGVDAGDRIQAIYKEAEVWQGCVYIVSQLESPAVVKINGKIHSLYFGSDSAKAEKLKYWLKIFSDARIEAFISENIELTTWEKFIFISPFASLTTYLDISIREIFNNNDYKETLIKLLNELYQIADARKIPFPENIIELTLTKMEKIPEGSISSMHRDFRKGSKTEIASLTEYIIRLGRQYRVATPTYTRVFNGLLANITNKKSTDFLSPSNPI